MEKSASLVKNMEINKFKLCKGLLVPYLKKQTQTTPQLKTLLIYKSKLVKSSLNFSLPSECQQS